MDLRLGRSTSGYLGIYEEIDVGLDAFPCTGGVTTCESLWMGVPVLSLCGVRPATRNSAGILARVGIRDWAVQTPDEYISFAIGLPAKLEQLAQVRSELREQCAEGLCDGVRFTRGLEDAYRAMWRRWCASRAKQ